MDKLGTIITSFHPAHSGDYKFSSFILISLIGSGILFLIGLWRYSWGYVYYGTIPAVNWSRIWFLIAVLIVLFLIIIVTTHVIKSRQFVKVYKNGLSYRLGLIKIENIFWEEIHGISTKLSREHFLHRKLTTRKSAKVYFRNREKIKITDNLEKFEDLITLLKANIYPRIQPKMHKGIKANHWIKFGPVMVHLNAIKIRLRRFPYQIVKLTWDQVKKIRIQSGQLILERKEKSQIKIFTSEIPNLEILLQLIKEDIQV